MASQMNSTKHLKKWVNTDSSQTIPKNRGKKKPLKISKFILQENEVLIRWVWLSPQWLTAKDTGLWVEVGQGLSRRDLPPLCMYSSNLVRKTYARSGTCFSSRHTLCGPFVGPVDLCLEPDTDKKMLSGTEDNSMGFIRTCFTISDG